MKIHYSIARHDSQIKQTYAVTLWIQHNVCGYQFSFDFFFLTNSAYSVIEKISLVEHLNFTQDLHEISLPLSVQLNMD